MVWAETERFLPQHHPHLRRPLDRAKYKFRSDTKFQTVTRLAEHPGGMDSRLNQPAATLFSKGKGPWTGPYTKFCANSLADSETWDWHKSWCTGLHKVLGGLRPEFQLFCCYSASQVSTGAQSFYSDRALRR